MADMVQWLIFGSRRHTERVIYSFYSFRYSFHLRTLDITRFLMADMVQWLIFGSRRHTERVIYSFYSFRYSFHLRTLDITYSSYSFYSFRILSLEGAGVGGVVMAVFIR